MLKYAGISFRIKIKDIPKFEELNNLSINVYTLEKIGKKHLVLPVYLSEKDFEKSIHLLMINSTEDVTDNEESMELDDNVNIVKHLRSSTNYHFIWIKNLSRLSNK